MSQRERLLTIGLVTFLLISIITSATTVYYYQELKHTNQQYSFLRNSVIHVNVTIDYGNGSSTQKAVFLALHSTALDAVREVAEVNATYYTAYQSWFINAINGVFNNEEGNNRWWVFEVNDVHALLSADQYMLSDGDRLEWIYYQY